MFRTFPLLCLLFLTAVRSENCDQDAGATLYCRGERALRNVLRNLNRSDKPLVVIRGLEIVPLQNNSISDEEPDQEQGLLDSLSFYLRTHEINVKLADLLEDESQVSGEWVYQMISKKVKLKKKNIFTNVSSLLAIFIY